MRPSPKTVLVTLWSCLLAVTLGGCASLTDSSEGSNSCSDARPATLSVTGVPGTTYACGLVQRNESSVFATASFFDKDISMSAYLVLKVGAAPGSYPVSAGNYGKIWINYDTNDQTDFCDAPSGTIVVTSYTDPGIDGDSKRQGRIEGYFNNVTLCGIYSSRKVASHTISGVFQVK